MSIYSEKPIARYTVCLPFCPQLMEAFLQHPQQALALCQSAGRGLDKAEAVKSVRTERKWVFTDTNILAYVGIRA